MGALSPMHWLIIVGVLVLLFGAKRLPDAARSVGRSARILKAEVKEMNPEPTAPLDSVAPAPVVERPRVEEAPASVVEAPATSSTSRG